jgi:hypothetical protein
MPSRIFRACAAVLALEVVLLASPAAAQSAGRGSHLPTESGQAVFAVIGEIIRLLEADPTTDWSSVDLEALRRHLRDMDQVALYSRVTATRVPGGEQWIVQGDGSTVAAIRRMTAAHVMMMQQDTTVVITRREIPRGVRLIVTARDAADRQAEAKIRALDFIGFMASGDHHRHHHLMIARGMMGGGHAHPR